MNSTSPLLPGWSGYVLLAIVYTLLFIGGVFKLSGSRTYVKTWKQNVLGHSAFLGVLLVAYLAVSYFERHLPGWLVTETIPGKNGNMESWFEYLMWIAIAVLCVLEVLWLSKADNSGNEEQEDTVSSNPRP